MPSNISNHIPFIVELRSYIVANCFTSIVIYYIIYVLFMMLFIFEIIPNAPPQYHYVRDCKRVSSESGEWGAGCDGQEL